MDMDKRAHHVMEAKSSTSPCFELHNKLSSKAKATGLFPNGTLSTRKKNFPKDFSDPNKISASSLKELGTLMGFGFPSSKTDCHEMFNEFQKNHEGLTIVDEEESLI